MVVLKWVIIKGQSQTSRLDCEYVVSFTSVAEFSSLHHQHRLKNA
jgi:hypothetical protein